MNKLHFTLFIGFCNIITWRLASKKNKYVVLSKYTKKAWESVLLLIPRSWPSNLPPC